jgi:phage terminase small subunit
MTTAHGHGSKLGLKQEALIAALLNSPTVEAAAHKAGCGETTAHRWLKLPEVKEAYRAARREVVTHAIVLLQRSTGAAIATILRNLKDDAPPAAQLKAAEMILKFSFDGLELEDLGARVDALEAQAQRGA